MTMFDLSQCLSHRTNDIAETAIIRMTQKARELKAQGKDVVSLAIGEPDFDTPRHIRQAAKEALENGFTHYAPIAGFPELRQALADKFRLENQLDYEPHQITVSNGAKQMISNACFALLNEGDEVILLAPFWSSYEASVRMAGGVPVILHAGVEDGFKVPARQIKAAMTDKTKLIFINSPANPTGAMYDEQELGALAAVVVEHPRVMVISDEIYEYIAFDGVHESIAKFPHMAERVIVINGFSKGFAMTGWRLGYAAGPQSIIAAMSKMQGAFSAGANAFVQQAAIAALQGARDEVEAMRQSYHQRRDMVAQDLQAMTGVTCPVPPGTFYIFPDVSALLGKKAGNYVISNVEELCQWLLAEHLVATVPGTAFGDAKCIRLSFAASLPELKKGVTRISEAFAKLV